MFIYVSIPTCGSPMNVIVGMSRCCCFCYTTQYSRLRMSPPTFPRSPLPTKDITKQIYVHTPSCLPRVPVQQTNLSLLFVFPFSFSSQLVALFLLAQFPSCQAPLPHTIDSNNYHIQNDSNNTYSFKHKINNYNDNYKPTTTTSTTKATTTATQRRGCF